MIGFIHSVARLAVLRVKGNIFCFGAFLRPRFESSTNMPYMAIQRSINGLTGINLYFASSC
jgi:hypothetical protein